MSKTIYQFKPWSRLKGDAQAVGEAIEGIIEENGAVGPRDVVERARDPASLLHSYFTWDDTEAAEKYRESQAAHLLRSIVAVRSDDVKIASPVRGFVPVNGADESDGADTKGAPARYVTIASATRVVAYREQMLRDALRDMDAYRIRYQLLADVSGLANALDKARATLDRALKAAMSTAAEEAA